MRPEADITFGRRLAEAIPGPSSSRSPAGRTFLPLDRPAEVAREIEAFAGA